MNSMPYGSRITRYLPITGLPLAFALIAVMILATIMAGPAKAQSSGDTESDNATEATEQEASTGDVETTDNEPDNTTTLTVSVSDSATKKAIGGATVFVITRPENVSRKETHPDVTTDSGSCTLADLPRGKITIIVSAQGMKSFKGNFVLGDDSQAKQTISIKLDADKPEIQDETRAEEAD